MTNTYKLLCLLLMAVVCMFTSPYETQAQNQHEVSGLVTDTTGEPLPGVNVVVQGTTTGTATNLDGEYELTIPSPDEILVFSLIGFHTREIAVDGRSTIDMELTTEVFTADELIVVGYGQQRERDVTGSMRSVRMSEIEGLNLTSPDQALMGRIAGMNVTQTTGLPGSGPQIRVRGYATVTAGSQPLYVIDGFALPQPDNPVDARLRNPLADIPVNDIESITVLKDASATAIYGSRGANGVIVVTTKSGSVREQTEINISASTGVSSRIASTFPKMSNARQFAEFQKHIWENRVAQGSADAVPQIYQNPEQLGEGTNWFEEVAQTAMRTNLNFSAGGGSENFRSYYSAGLIHEEGIVPGSDYTRASFRANLDANFSDRLSGGLRLAPTYTVRNQAGSSGEGRGSIFGTGLQINPIVTPYDEDGNLIPHFGNVEPEVPGAWTHANPIFEAQNRTDQRTGIRMLATTYLDWELVDGLVARTTFNVDIERNRAENFHPSIVGTTNNPPPIIPSGGETEVFRLNWLSETTLNYQQSDFGPGRIDALAGFTLQEQARDRSMSFSGNFPDDVVRTMNVASNITGNSNEEKWSMMSALGRINYYLLDDRYIFTGTVRADGSSRFGEDNRWGVFPSLAVAWNISNEDFYGDLATVMPELKTRLSFGLTGNNQIGNFASVGTVSSADYIFGESVAGGRALSSFANRELGWETVEEWNAGIDMSLLNYRLNITIDAYSRTTRDMLLNREISTVSGFTTVTENVGSMRNRGLEFSVNANPVSGPNFSWVTDFNLSINRNKVLSLPEDEPILVRDPDSGRASHITTVGQPIGMHYGFIVEGVFMNEQEIEQYPTFGLEVPGNLRYRDVNGDGQITPEGDFAIIGNPHPDFTFGFNQRLSYRSFDFSMSITGSIGNDITRTEYFRTARNIDGLFNVSADYAENFWRSEENPGNGFTPTPLGHIQHRGFYRTSHSLNIVDASNLWLRSAMIRYNLPPDLLGTRSANIYLSGQNLFILSGYRGNPDAQWNIQRGGATSNLAVGADFIGYPVSRSFTVGIELGF